MWNRTGKNPEHTVVKHYNSDLDTWNIIFENQEYNPNDQYISELKYFFKCVENCEAPMNNPEEAIDVLRVID